MLKKAEAKALLLDGAELLHSHARLGMPPYARIAHSRGNEFCSEYVRLSHAQALIEELRLKSDSPRRAAVRVYTVPKEKKA